MPDQSTPKRRAPRPRVECVCATCGTTYMKAPGKVEARRTQYCSRACWLGGPRAMTALTCPICGKAFRRKTVELLDANYCSRSCSAKSRTRDRNPHWKGGRFVNGEDGYISIRVGKTYEFEHRLIMQEHLGRDLLPHEVVHHKNGVVDDNRIENLEVMIRSDHMLMHRQMKRELRKLG